MTTDTQLAPPDAEIKDLYAEQTGFILDDSPAALLDFARAVLARWGQPAHSGEPVYAFRRKGLDDFCTCTEKRYAELSAKPNLFETRIFYTTPPAPAADSVQEARASHGQAPAPTHEQIAAYLESTGAYVTNDATREAAIAEAIDTDRAKRGQAPDLHPKTSDLVQRFAAALAEKLSAAEKKYGYSDGWASPNWMDECRQHLSAHIAKGDPRDVAAYCAFLWHHGATTASPRAEQQAPTESEIYVCARKCYNCGHAGINDDHADNAACKSCDWSGPSPEKDHCPDCEKDGTMTAACPMCSCAYIMVADTQVAAPAALNAPQPAPPADSVLEDAASAGFFLQLPQRPKPEAPAGTVGLDWDAYSGAQMLAYGRDCSNAAIVAAQNPGGL